MTGGTIIRTGTHGYVVENFLGECKITGTVYPIMTVGGKPAIFPDKESVPPKWRKHMREASMGEAAKGVMMYRVVNVVSEYDEDGNLIDRYQKKDERNLA